MQKWKKKKKSVATYVDYFSLTTIDHKALLFLNLSTHLLIFRIVENLVMQPLKSKFHLGVFTFVKFYPSKDCAEDSQWASWSFMKYMMKCMIHFDG